MRMLPIYRSDFACDHEDAAFEYLTRTFKHKLLTWSYFVNWEKVCDNVKAIELDLNTL